MKTWFGYLKRGLSRTLTSDRIAGRQGYTGVRANLQSLRPFAAHHWRKGGLGALLILFASLLAFPHPLIIRYGEVILDIQHDLLDRVLRFPKSFFDDKETGYLMSWLSSDVRRLRVSAQDVIVA